VLKPVGMNYGSTSKHMVAYVMFPFAAYGVVPVVPAACIFDLMCGKPEPPTAEDVYQAVGR
jgi:hypothetical protein